jgi:signal peptidase I
MLGYNNGIFAAIFKNPLMSSQDLFVLVLISVLMVLLPGPGLYKMFEKAGIPAWKGLVPFVNTWEIVKAARLRKHWFFWQFIPVAGWFITLWFFIEWVKLFGKFRLYQHALAAFLPFIYFPYLGFDKNEKFKGVEVVRKHKKTAVREWIDAAVFAIIAATLIRTFVFEAYTIPTASMEKTLLVNDFLFVSKLSYGPRIPNTPLAVPFVHHTTPIFNSKSYSEAIRIPYRRWFASPVKRNDVVVFNFPAGDTLTVEEDSRNPYYDILRDQQQQAYFYLKSQGTIKDEAALQRTSYDLAREKVWTEYTVTTRPVDKRENYIKRCVGIPGDTITIINSVLHVNGKPAFVPPNSAYNYIVRTNNKILNEDELIAAGVSLRMTEGTSDFNAYPNNLYLLNLTPSELEIVKKIPGVVSADIHMYNYDPKIFPSDSSVVKWSQDNFGPLWVPAKGATIPLNAGTLAFYRRVIGVYEGNKVEERNGTYLINGQAATTYTFKMNYYWMMGDNRHNSQDSRYWGFVPEDHVVGEAWMIWMSWDQGVRWGRLFNIIR